jgi:hypothetical protein
MSSLDRGLDIFARDLKKRRATMPSSNDSERSWKISNYGAREAYDDGEEDVLEHEMGVAESDGNQWKDNGQYKATNSLLHDLHVLNQHRRMFSSPSPPSTSSLEFHSSYNTSLAGSCSTTMSRHQRTDSDMGTPKVVEDIDDSSSRLGDVVSMEEAQSVQQHYQDTNRLVIHTANINMNSTFHPPGC